jgi:hypothetical protein
MGSRKKQFRIKYYDYEDSELYTIIQIASNEPRAISDAEERLARNSSRFIILEIEQLNAQYYIREIRRILTTSINERNEPSWLRRKRKTMG